MMSRVIIFIITSLAIPSLSEAAVAPFGIGFFPPVQIPYEQWTIAGIRINPIMGRHRHVAGIDVGLAWNESVESFTGIGVALGVNKAKAATITGLQVAGIANYNTDRVFVVGLQASLVTNRTPRGSIIGLQVSGYNNGKDVNVYGVQLGLVNKAKNVWGFQIGLVNQAKDLHGIQIGLVNFNEASALAFMPILNLGF